MVNPEMKAADARRASDHLAAGEDLGLGKMSAAAARNASETYDWPPDSFAENDHILVWWLPEYDDLLRQLVEEYQWAWRSALFPQLETLIPEPVLRSWRDADPECREYSWYNVLGNFAAARAKQLGIRPRPPQPAVCSCCSREFLESHLPYAFIIRLGASQLDVCDKCLSQALHAKGSATSPPETAIAVMQALSRALQRPAKGSDLNGRLDLGGLSRDVRAAVIQALRVKPSVSRVNELFGSWKAAVAHAAATPLAPLPPYDPEKPATCAAETPFTSNDPARYKAAIGPLPDVELDADGDAPTYTEEVASLIGTGYLALAEASLTRLREFFDTREYPMLAYLQEEVYRQTARFDEAQATTERQWPGQEEPPDKVLTARDVRTITPGPVFYEPLTAPPQGNVRFVLIGGPMEYVDRRGEHTCVTGAPPDGGDEAEFAESVTRMNAMVDGAPWIQAATETGQAIMTSLARGGADTRPYGHLVSYVTTSFRDAVKALTGTRPQKVAEDAWRIGLVGKSGWSYQRDAGQYVFNANAGFTFMAVEAAPAVCIWGWPDRSDLCLQAFLDTIASRTRDPVTMLLPDVPAFRSFARRYVRGERMEKAERALIEEQLYRVPGDMINKRGYVISAEFAPQLIVHPDGTEDVGAVLASALAYLSAHHTLRLSVWDVLSDALLRHATATGRVPARPFTVSASERADTVAWYSQLLEYDDIDTLLSPYRPSLLDAVISA